uniref:response regulator transcription factor n=1 Tax=Acetatifactor sp. TaxID=1872090 RepID=UPI0040579532
MHKILIVEDDVTIAGAVAEQLRKWEMQVQCVGNFQKVTEEFGEYLPDLVLMDIQLPYYNGFYWCSEIRKESKVPIVFLSSADDNMNIVMAMNMGGDDFISKPFDLSVLTAKVQAMLRRTYAMEMKTNILEHKGVSLNLNDTTLLCGSEKVILTKNEFLILRTLLERIGKVVSREEIMERLWGNDEFVDDNTLTVNMTRLRKKLEQNGCGEFIETKRGMGYIIE